MKRIFITLVVLTAILPAGAKQRQLKLLVFDTPRYPFVAVADGIEGVVNLRLTVGQSGKVQAAEVLSGPEQLRASAVDAAKKMIFECEDCTAKNTMLRDFSIRYEIRGKPTEERRERARRSGDGMLTVTITPLPKEANAQ